MFETSSHNVNEYRHRALLRELLLGLYLLSPDSESMVQEVDFKQFMQGLPPVSRYLQLTDVDWELSAGLNRAKVTFQMVLRYKV
jgi:hypothetical protein